MGCQRPSRFWGLGCPKIYHEAEDTLVFCIYGSTTAGQGHGEKSVAVLAARREVAEIHIEEDLQRYVVRIVNATRDPGKWLPEWQDAIRFGASPRASLALVRAASAHAYLQERDYVIPDDIIEMAGDVLRHRIIPSFSARSQQLGSDDLIRGILDSIPVP